MHHGIIHKENPIRCNSVSKFYFIFIWSSTCFERHTAHHQEPKTALAASGFAYVEGCWMCSCWTLSGRISSTLPDSVQQLHVQKPSTYAKPEAASAFGSWRWVVCHPKHVELHIYIWNKILIHCCILLDFLCKFWGWNIFIHTTASGTCRYPLPTKKVKWIHN